MADKKSRILLVEDEAPLAALYTQYLKDEDATVRHVATGAAAKEILLSDPPDAMLLDVRLPDMEGTELLDVIKQNNLTTAVIMITAHGSINMAVETMRGGAYDFLVKPFNRQRLVDTLKNALEREVIRREVVTEAKPVPNPSTKGFHGFVGESNPMKVVYRMIESAAGSKATVFITGESGTGKEVCAESIHRLSNRAKKPLVVLNCAAIPKDLMESEIFGHVKGAFTGAITDHDGAATQADGGTLFLDEICEMDLHLQSKLLRFIQTGTFQKVGSAKSQTVNIRFVCATNRDPLAEIGAGRFREDLYYRLHVIPMHLPPLRERGPDIMQIANKFLVEYAAEEGKKFRAFDPVATRRMSEYAWPGNVRQLQNVIRNTVVLNQGEQVRLDMLPPPLNGQSETSGALSNRSLAGTPARPTAFPAQGSITMPHRPGGNGATPQPIPGKSIGVSGGQPMYPDAFNPAPQRTVSADSRDLGPAAAAVQDLVGNAYGVPRAGGADGGAMMADGMGGMATTGTAPGGGMVAAPTEPDSIVPLWETEKRAIEAAIDSCNGNIPKAAALLGISASTIYRKKQQWEGQSV